MASNNPIKLPQKNWSESAHRFLTTTVPASKGIAAFDFDNTLVKNDFGEAVMNVILKEGIPGIKTVTEFASHFSKPQEAEALWKERKTNPEHFVSYIWKEYVSIMEKHGLEKAYRWSAFIFSGWSESEIKKLTRRVWQEELSSHGETNIKPYPEMQDLVKYLLEHGWDVYIVTASPQWIIEEIAEEFFISPQNVLGMHLKTIGGISLPEIVEPFTYGSGKVEALFRKTGKSADLALGDSINDFPLLQSAIRKGFLIDRGNVALKEQCEKIGCLTQPVFL